MKVQKPIIHGRDHLPGGADPVPMTSGLGGDWAGRVLSLSGLVGFWRLGEGASPYHDTSGYTPATPIADMVRIAGAAGAMTQDVTPGLLPAGQDDGAVGFNYASTSGTGTDRLEALASSRFAFAGTNPFTAVARIKPGASPLTFFGGIVGDMNVVAGSPAWLGGWILRLNWPAMTVSFARGSSASVFTEAVSTAVSGGTVYTVAGTYDGATLSLYINGTLAASQADTSSSAGPFNLQIGGYSSSGSVWSPFYGVVDEVAVWNRALTAAEIAGLHDGAVTPDTAGAGWVPAADGAGGVVWQPPGVEVTHGGGTPDPAPADGAPVTGGGTSISGWHLDAHHETAVLYDSTPARFDVPSRKWVRVPFNAVRIQRAWETTVGGPTRSAWLPDDRGLTGQARDGLLHIGAGMEGIPDPIQGSHIINGWHSIEYPVLDYLGLPDFTGGSIIAPDAYARSARILNASTGVVLRRLPGSNQRRFIEWKFLDDADGMTVSVLYTVDNPYPLYPAWPERPLTLPQPYPRLSPTDSLAWYLTPAGNPGYDDGSFDLHQNLVVGDNLCLQAWQDSPWLIRFSTDHFPNYRPSFVPAYLARPFLSVSYSYDPETINHTTGKLL